EDRRAKAAVAKGDEDDELDLGEVEEDDAEGKPTRRKATLKDISPVIGPILARQHKELRAAKKELEAIKARDQRREAEVVNAAIDKGFEKLGDKYKEVVGEGGHQDLDPKSAEMETRMAIINAAGISLAEDS